MDKEVEQLRKELEVTRRVFIKKLKEQHNKITDLYDTIDKIYDIIVGEK